MSSRDGRALPALAQATKMGHLFLLDRETGVPLFPVEERSVPQAGAPGETLSPHAAVPDAARAAAPAGALARRRLGPHALGPGQVSREDRREPLAGDLHAAEPGGLGRVSGGRRRHQLGERRVRSRAPRAGGEHEPHGERRDARSARSARVRRSRSRSRGAACIRSAERAFAATVDVLVSPLGVPCTAPPWGTLLALEVETGRVLWQVPFGSTRDLAPFPFWFDWGLPSMGGPIVTASGVVFIGAAMDDYLRAFDVETGALLWKQRLPAGAQATPMTYRLRPDGRQFVVIAAGGHGTMGTTLGDELLAFALA